MPLDRRQQWRMAKPGMNNKVVRNGLFVFSIVLLAWIVFTVW
jgi:cell division protein FtsB